MTYQGDIIKGGILYFNFTTRALATGVPIVLSGTPVISIYKDDVIVQTTVGVTLTVSIDGVVGLNNVKIDTADAFYVAGSDYSLVMTAGTVDTRSVVGEVVGSFSIENRFEEVDVTKVGGVAQNLPTATALATVDTNVSAILVDTAEIGAAGAGLTTLASAASITALNDIAITDIVSNGAITTLAGAVTNVTTCTTNTDMRGTDGANTTVPDNASITSILADTSVIGVAGVGLTNLGGMSTTMKAEVNTEVADVIKVDPIPEIAQGVPPVTPSLSSAIMLLYMALRNNVDVDANFKTISNSTGTVITKKALSDSGTTYSEAETVTGP